MQINIIKKNITKYVKSLIIVVLFIFSSCSAFYSFYNDDRNTGYKQEAKYTVPENTESERYYRRRFILDIDGNWVFKIKHTDDLKILIERKIITDSKKNEYYYKELGIEKSYTNKTILKPIALKKGTEILLSVKYEDSNTGDKFEIIGKTIDYKSLF